MIEHIKNRTSYRGEFKDTIVPREDLIDIVEAGLAAPSGCNKQTTSFIIIDDKELLSKLKSIIDPPIALTAPAFIIVLTRRIIAYRDKCFSIQDYSAAIENMLIEIVAHGYDSCWYEGHITDKDNIAGKLAEYLGVSDEYEIVCVLPVGIAADEKQHVIKKSFDERVWINGFKNKEIKCEKIKL